MRGETILSWILYTNTVLLNASLVDYIYSSHIKPIEEIKEFLTHKNLISLQKYHTSEANILTIIIEKTNVANWVYLSNELIHEIQINLQISTLIFDMKHTSQGCESEEYLPIPPSAIFFPSRPVPNYVNDYPAESKHSYILLVESSFNLLTYVGEGHSNVQQKHWNSKDNFLILIARLLSENCYDMDYSFNISKQLWERTSISNVVTYVKSFVKCDIFQDKIFVHDPFYTVDNVWEMGRIIEVNPNDLHTIPKTYLHRIWNMRRYRLRIPMFDIFPTATRVCGKCNLRRILYADLGSHLPKEELNTYKCIYKGRDWEVLKHLAAYMNFTPVIIPQRFAGDVFESIEHLDSKISDMTFNERYMKHYNNSGIQFTMPAFYTRKIVVIVAKAQKIPIWSVMWKYFSGHFWIYFAVSLTASAILWYLLRRTRENVSQISNALDMLAIFVTMSVDFITKIVNSSQRILLTSCLFSSLIIMCYFQSSLLDVISHPHLYPEINTLAQLDEANIPIITVDSSLIDTFDESLAMANLAHKVVYEKSRSANEIIYQIIHFRNASLLTSNMEASWYEVKYLDQLHIVGEYPREYFVSYLIPKGSPYATRIHNLLGKMVAGGLVSKWDVDTGFSLKLEAMRERRYIIDDNYPDMYNTVVTFYNIIISFVVLGIGIGISFVSFVFEVLWWFYCTVYLRTPDGTGKGDSYIIV